MEENRYVFYYRGYGTVGRTFVTIEGGVSEKTFVSVEDKIRKESPNAIITGFDLLEE